MLKFIPKPIATAGLLLLFSVIIIFHMLVLVGIIPYEIVWGGRLADREQMLVFEAVSIGLNLIMLSIVAIHSGLWKVKTNSRILIISLWVMTALFLLNTVGNLFSKSEMEKMIFTPVTLVLFVFCLRLATSK